MGFSASISKGFREAIAALSDLAVTIKRDPSKAILRSPLSRAIEKLRETFPAYFDRTVKGYEAARNIFRKQTRVATKARDLSDKLKADPTAVLTPPRDPDQVPGQEQRFVMHVEMTSGRRGTKYWTTVIVSAPPGTDLETLIQLAGEANVAKPKDSAGFRSAVGKNGDGSDWRPTGRGEWIG